MQINLRVRKILTRLSLTAGLIGALSGVLLAAPNPYESAIIKKQVQASFRIFIDMWKEELYFDMYDQGQGFSKKKLSKAEFSQRMVDLPWRPSLRKIRIIDIKTDYRNFTSIYFIMEMENKINPQRKLLKQYTFHAIMEKKGWVFDLTQIIRVPFIGKHVDYEEEAKELALQAKKAQQPTPGTPPAAAPTPP